MATGAYEWQSEFARKYVGQGREEGLAQGKREALLRPLDALPGPVGTDARRRIEDLGGGPPLLGGVPGPPRRSRALPAR